MNHIGNSRQLISRCYIDEKRDMTIQMSAKLTQERTDDKVKISNYFNFFPEYVC